MLRDCDSHGTRKGMAMNMIAMKMMIIMIAGTDAGLCLVDGNDAHHGVHL